MGFLCKGCAQRVNVAELLIFAYKLAVRVYSAKGKKPSIGNGWGRVADWGKFRSEFGF